MLRAEERATEGKDGTKTDARTEASERARKTGGVHELKGGKGKGEHRGGEGGSSLSA